MTIRATTKRINKSRQVLSKYEGTVKRIIAAGGNLVMNEAKSSLNDHRSSGQTYTKYNPKRTHTASTAGNPPNTDTGYLANNIYLIIEENGLAADIESRADYSEALEFGTSTIAARPFMQPALESQRKKIRSMFAKLRQKGV